MNINRLLLKYVDYESRFLKLQLNGRDVNEWMFVLRMTLENGICGNDFLEFMEYLNRYNAVGCEIAYGINDFGPFYVDDSKDSNTYLKKMGLNTLWGHPTGSFPVTMKYDQIGLMAEFMGGFWYDNSELLMAVNNYIDSCVNDDSEYTEKSKSGIDCGILDQMLCCMGYYIWMDTKSSFVGVCLNLKNFTDEHGLGIRIRDGHLDEIGHLDVSYQGYM